MIKEKTCSVKKYVVSCSRCRVECAYDATSHTGAINNAKNEGFKEVGFSWLCNGCINELILPQIYPDLKLGDKVEGTGGWTDCYCYIAGFEYRIGKIIPDLDRDFKVSARNGGGLPITFGLFKKVE